MFAPADLMEADIPPPSEEPVWEDDFGLHLGESIFRSIADVQTILFHLLEPFHDFQDRLINQNLCPMSTLRSIRPSCPLVPHQTLSLPSCITDMHFPTCFSYIVNTC
jgi:hypothetical protein